jgi:cytochrome P450
VAHPFDATDPEFIADPYPVFADLRKQAEVHRHDGLGIAVAVSHRACSELLRQRSLGRIWTDASPPERFAAFNLLHQNSLLESEPPRHTRLRKLISAAFNRGHTERLRPWVRNLAGRMVDSIGSRGDLLEHLAAPLPVEVIGELLGVPDLDRPLLQPWSNAIVKMYEYGLPDPLADAAERAASEFVTYLRDLSKRPTALISDLIETGLDPDEVIGTAVLLLMAGHEATVNVIGNGVLALMRHRDQWERLVAEPELVPLAVEELIRYDSPLQLFERTATVETEVAGYPVAAGEKVAALLGAAARDPEVFDHPEGLDIGRNPNPHLGFGAGIHYCVGAPLARVEIGAALEALIEQMPNLRLDGEPERRPEFVIRGLRTLPVAAS